MADAYPYPARSHHAPTPHRANSITSADRSPLGCTDSPASDAVLYDSQILQPISSHPLCIQVCSFHTPHWLRTPSSPTPALRSPPEAERAWLESSSPTAGCDTKNPSTTTPWTFPKLWRSPALFRAIAHQRLPALVVKMLLTMALRSAPAPLP